MIFRNNIADSSWGVIFSGVAKKRDGRGGARAGAGRKRIVQDPESITIAFEKPDLEAIRELASKRGASPTALIRKAVSQFLQRSRRK